MTESVQTDSAPQLTMHQLQSFKLEKLCQYQPRALSNKIQPNFCKIKTIEILQMTLKVNGNFVKILILKQDEYLDDCFDLLYFELYDHISAKICKEKARLRSKQ